MIAERRYRAIIVVDYAAGDLRDAVNAAEHATGRVAQEIQNRGARGTQWEFSQTMENFPEAHLHQLTDITPAKVPPPALVSLPPDYFPQST